MLTALWRRLARWHPTYRKENHVSNSHLDSLLNLMPPIGCFVPLYTGRLVRKLFYPYYRGCPAVSGSALPDHAKHTSGDRFMSINTLRERPIPPHPKGWGLLGQQVEAIIYDRMQSDSIQHFRIQLEPFPVQSIPLECPMQRLL